MSAAPQVILWDQSGHRWEVWQQSRPLASAHDLTLLRHQYPRAEGPSQHQVDLATHDGWLAS